MNYNVVWHICSAKIVRQKRYAEAISWVPLNTNFCNLHLRFDFSIIIVHTDVYSSLFGTLP